MDLLNSVSQCHFCTHLNTAFAPQCELCHELLSVSNMLLASELMAPPLTPQFCRHCSRRLLYNQRTCAFCNAQGSATPFSRLSILENLHMDLIQLTLLPLPTLTSVNGEREQERGLSAAARDQFLRRIAIDSTCTTAVCPVCLEVVAVSEDSRVEVVQLPCCRNKFHSACVRPWFNTHNSCPTCRQNLNDMITN